MQIRIQIQGHKKMRILIQIQGLQKCGSNADPDPKPWFSVSVYCDAGAAVRAGGTLLPGGTCLHHSRQFDLSSDSAERHRIKE